jgi:hypothetical protein
MQQNKAAVFLFPRKRPNSDQHLRREAQFLTDQLIVVGRYFDRLTASRAEYSFDHPSAVDPMSPPPRLCAESNVTEGSLSPSGLSGKETKDGPGIVAH